jgi:hypothetical protein
MGDCARGVTVARGELEQRFDALLVGISYLARRRTPTPADDERDWRTDARIRHKHWQRTKRANGWRAVQRLPVAHRQVMTLALEGLSYGDIAERRGDLGDQRGRAYHAGPTDAAGAVEAE